MTPASASASAPAAGRTLPKAIWLNGQLVPSAEAVVSVFDHGLLYGDGVFEGIRAYNGRVLKLRSHLERLQASAEAIHLDIPYSLDELDTAVRETLKANDRTEAYIRLCVTRGAGSLGLHPFTCERATVFVIADGIRLYPQELYDNGMQVIVAKTARNHPAALSPAIKSMNYLNNILAKIEAIDAGVLEAIMLNHEGNVSECTGDNIFLVQRDGDQTTLITPPASAGVLEGITMLLVCDLARQAGFTVKRQDFRLETVYAADEMFLTGTAAEVIPVTSVGDHTIGDGTVGPITRQLKQAFAEMVGSGAPED